jgi:hypothetical protein
MGAQPSALREARIMQFVIFGSTLRLACIALLLAAAASGTLAAEITVGGVSINLPSPTGFCELSESEPSDKRVMTILGDLVAKGGNKLLVMSADCQELTDWHTHKRALLDDLAQYQTTLRTMNEPRSAGPTASIAQTCNTWRAERDKIALNLTPDVKLIIEKTLERIRLNEAGFIGVLDEDSNACYAGLIQKFQTEAGTNKTQLVVYAKTIVKNKTIFVHRIATYLSDETVSETLAKLKTNVAAMLAANQH